MKNFVLISLPRSGSSMIVNTLNSLDEFNVYGEVFARFNKNTEINHPQDVQAKMIIRNKINSFDLSIYNNVEEYLDNLYSGDRITGFKLLYPHIKRSFGNDIIKYINSKNIYKILLYRENKIKQFLSMLTNKKKDKIYCDPMQMIRRIKIMERKEKELYDIFPKIDINVSYECITNENDIEYLNLSSFFPIKKKVRVPLRKYRPSKIRDNILNYDNVILTLKKEVPNMIKWIENE